jgi:hypothetical protein
VQDPATRMNSLPDNGKLFMFVAEKREEKKKEKEEKKRKREEERKGKRGEKTKTAPGSLGTI